MCEETEATLCVVLHYGSASDTWACVRTLTGVEGLEVLVADNDPAQDLSVPGELTGRVEILRTGGSAGFAEANNMAVKHGRSQSHDAVLLLNNDTLVADDALKELRAVLSEAGVGAVGPCMPSTRAENGIWACGGFIDKLRVVIGGLQPPADGLPCDVDYLPGAAILCSFEAWDSVGGLPERYFLTYEEAEFALRVKDRGYRIMVAPEAIVLHKGGVSTDRRPMYVYNLIRSRIRLAQYMWGPACGLLLASAASLRGAVRTSHGWNVWVRAVWHEIHHKALDCAALLEIGHRYPGA